MSAPNATSLCERCGERLGTHMRSGEEIAPTDRGDERRATEEWVCDDCDDEARI